MVVLLAASFPGEPEAQIRNPLRRHIDEAVLAEWPTMAFCKNEQLTDTFSLLLAESSNALTAPKSNHIVTMLPSFKAVMSEPLPFFPVGNWWRAKCDRNLIFFERPFTCSCFRPCA
jgi:hypothetical protein